MERIQSINPERIRWCCADRGISLDQLALETGISAGSLERAIAGDNGLTFNQLRTLAAYFGRGVLFFMETGAVNEGLVHTPAFRTLANQKPELSAKLKLFIEQVEQQRDVYVSLREDLVDHAPPEFMPPDLPAEPKAAAEVARRWLGLSLKNSFDSYRAAIEARGILVFRSNGYNGKWQIAKESPILGFTLYDVACPVIVVKKQASETQQTFTLMHELGHLLLHKASSIDDEQDLQAHQGCEREANAFAGHLLVPDGFLATIDDKERPETVSLYEDWLEQPRKAWGISTEVILRRLLDAGRLSQHDYTAYRQWRSEQPFVQKEGGTRAYRSREPKHIFGDKFVRTVLDALNARHITMARASSYLDGLKISHVHQLERHYAGL